MFTTSKRIAVAIACGGVFVMAGAASADSINIDYNGSGTSSFDWQGQTFTLQDTGSAANHTVIGDSSGEIVITNDSGGDGEISYSADLDNSGAVSGVPTNASIDFIYDEDRTEATSGYTRDSVQFFGSNTQSRVYAQYGSIDGGQPEARNFLNGDLRDQSGDVTGPEEVTNFPYGDTATLSFITTADGTTNATYDVEEPTKGPFNISKDISNDSNFRFDSLLLKNAGPDGQTATFEDLNYSVPEPASMALLGLGGLVMFSGRRRRRA